MRMSLTAYSQSSAWGNEMFHVEHFLNIECFIRIYLKGYEYRVFHVEQYRIN